MSRLTYFQLKLLSAKMEEVSSDITMCYNAMSIPRRKWTFFIETCNEIVHLTELDNKDSVMETEILRNGLDLAEKLNHRYQYLIAENKLAKKYNYDRYTGKPIIPWSCHDSHFHVSLDDYIKCPSTSLPEISDFCTRLLNSFEEA